MVSGPMATLLLAGGCYRREESIVIRPDGGATVTYTVGGNAQDVAEGDAMPSGPGWVLVEKTEDGGDPDKMTCVWRLDLDDLNDYPATMAATDDPRAAVSLATETRLEVEKAPGRTIYRFSRRYVGRRVRFLEQ